MSNTLNIPLKVNLDFKRNLDVLKEKYGEAFEILNGFHESQLNFSDFIDGFIDKNVADVTIDANANASNKDIRSMMTEKGKSEDKLFAFSKIFYEITKKYNLKTAKEWLETEYNGGFYLHDASTSTYMPYCYAVDLTRLATEGLFFLPNYNNQPPKHLTTFMDDVIEFISYMSNRSSGAVGIPNVLIWAFYFWKHDCETGHIIKDPDYYMRQFFQKLVYRLNQPFMRIDQSSFCNVSIFDRYYLESLFGGVEYPDGTFVVDYIDDIIEFQKIFMEVVSSIRSENMFTFPVLSYSLLKRDDITEEEAAEMIRTKKYNVFKDEEFAHWCSDHNTKWNDSNFFMSDNVGVLSNCCFDGNQICLSKSSDGVNYMTFKQLYESSYNTTKRNFTIFHNGSWVKGKIIKLPKRDMYKITTSNNKELYVTDNHIFPTLEGDKQVSELNTDDYLMFNSRPLNAVTEQNRNLTYEQGYLIGMYLGDGSMYGENSDYTPTINLSLNKEKYEDNKNIINEAIESIDSDVTMRLAKPYHNVYPVSIRNRKVYEFIREYVYGKYGNEKELNLNCLLQNLDFRKGILNGFYATDGGNSNRIYTTSEKLVSQIECLITSLGMSSVIDVSDRTDEPVIIRDQEYKRNYPLYCIRYYTPMNRRTQQMAGFKVKNNSDFYKISSIEKYDYEDEFVYCFEMNNLEEPYFTLPNGVITHNCRLLSNTKKLNAFINSIGGTALSIGSVKVNTINLMRIAIESNNDEEKYLEILHHRTDLCCKTLDIIRHIISRNIEKGLLPNYQDGAVELDKQYCTVGILGLYEVIESFGYTEKDEFGYISYTDKGIEFASKIFEVLNDVKDNFTDKYSFNIESVPAERAAVILCQKDNLLYDLDDKFIYSNQWIPLTEKCTIKEKLKLCSILDEKCSGGSIAHINLESNFPTTDMAWDMLNQIALSGVIYFAFNTRINECKNHHGFVGTDRCPSCGEPVFDTYQRIVGFLVPSRAYSKDRFREFNARQWYNYADMLGDI